ncbi:hypothetical protein Y032_0647g1098 [Ancylostoma ceylanicum]|nr:hypothetical protein Y032_0647g1098 [Ancylostoma ceylanicum]
MDTAVATGTLTIYRRVRRNFLDFIRKFRFPIAGLPKLRNVFIAHLINQGKQKALGYHIAALAHFFGPLTDEDADIQRALLGTASRKGMAVKHRTKASPHDVQKIVEWALSIGSLKAVSAGFMIQLAYAAFLRVSELCHLQFADLTCKEGSTWWLTIEKSKTDQLQTGATIAFQLDDLGESLRKKFWELKNAKFPSEFIFSSRNGSAPSRDFIVRQIKWAVASAGLGSRGLTTHSFRGGAATAAVRAGKQTASIMRAGRWKSAEAFQCYVGPTPL